MSAVASLFTLMATKKTTQTPQPTTPKVINYCGTCKNCTPYYAQHTLTVKDKKPTMGKCPKIANRFVLLSERACSDYNKDLIIAKEEETVNK